MSRHNRLALAALATVAAASSHALATPYTWTNPADGTWTNVANWNPSSGAPTTPFDSAAFNLGPSDPAAFAAYTGYTVSLPANVALVTSGTGGIVNIGTDKVTFTGHTVNAYNLLVATSAGQTAVLNLVSGGGASGYYGTTIANNGGHGTINLVGGSFNSAYDDYVGYHAGSVGAFNVTAASTAYTGSLFIGAAGGTGHVTVDGAGSKLQTQSSGGSIGYIRVGDATSVGTLDVTNGGTVETFSSITVAAGSSLSVSGAGSKITEHTSFSIAGIATASAGGTLEDVTGFGITVTPTGTLKLAGGTASAHDVTNSGTITGSGTLAAFNALLKPTSTLALSITSPSSYDHIGGIGNLTFAGTLAVTADPSYAPHPGDTFDLLDFFYDPISGTTTAFSALSLPPLPPDMSLNTSALYTTGTISVVPEPTSLLALVTLPLLSRRRRGT